MIYGIEVMLYPQVGEDELGAPIWAEAPEPVQNVLVGAPDTEKLANEVQLYGKKLAYTLAVPKGDTNSWENALVEFFGQKFKVYGDVVQGMENMIPLPWNKQVKVERYG